MDKTILSADCLLYPKDKAAQAILTKQEITIQCESGKEIISVADITGCQLLRGNRTTKAQWYLCLFYYPMCKKLMKGVARHRMVRSIGFPSNDSVDSKGLVELWIVVLKHLIAGTDVTSDQVFNLTTPPARKLIVYVNPFSGSGKAMKIYEKYVKPMFAEAQIQHQLVKTEYAGQAREMARELLVDKYDGIVIVSGDGLVHEVLNGLMDRPDWNSCIKTPIGVVPGGSGNALAASILYACNRLVRSRNIIEESLFEIIRGETRDLSLVYAEAGGKKFYSFLSFGWGFTADVDIESEKYRSLGDARFTIGCLVRVASLRKYHGMISYLPANSTKWKDSNEELLKSRSTSMNDSASPSILTASASHEVVGMSYKSYHMNNTVSTGETEPLSPPSIPVKSLDDLDLVPTREVPSSHPFYLPEDISSPIPPEWNSVEDEFVWITPIFLSHLGEDMFMMPCAELNDEVMYLYCLKSSVSKMDLLQILLSVDKGTHLNLSPQNTMVLPCKAFRLEPYVSHTGYMTADGERIPHQPLQASVTNIKAKVMCSSRKRKPENTC